MSKFFKVISLLSLFLFVTNFSLDANAQEISTLLGHSTMLDWKPSPISTAAPQRAAYLASRLSLDMSNAPLEKILDRLTVLTGVHFSYVKGVVSEEKTINVQMSKVTLADAMNTICSKFSLRWVAMEGNNIVITENSKDAEGSARISGKVLDASTGMALPGANVLLKGTSIGASTDLNGDYTITNIPVGSYTIRATYIGYRAKHLFVTVLPNQTLKLNLRLNSIGVKGKEVVVTAQASAQNAAINQQLSANQIMNVVSAARISELPDENAAESVGRLPGIFVLRSGGEGYEVVVRGMAPQYNEITINGIQMASSNASNRSTDLSDISSSMLEGIQVSKTVTPDMDANVIGGVVNFEMREAKVKQPGVPDVSLLMQGGYNNLPDAYNKFNNYKYVGSVEDRLFNDKLGVFAQAEVQRLNLTSNELSVGYTHFGNSNTQYVVSGVDLYYIPRDKLVYNGALDLDYEYGGGSIKMMNFLSTGTTNIQQQANEFNIGSNAMYYALSGKANTLNTISDLLDFKQRLPLFDLEVKAAHSYSETKAPNNWDVSFFQNGAGLAKFSTLQNINPQAVPDAAVLDFPSAYLFSLDDYTSFSKSRNLTASIDLRTEVTLSPAVTAQIKFGGMTQYITRSYTYSEYDTPQLLSSGGAVFVDNLINSNFSLPINSSELPVTYFIDPNFKFGTFLDGSYKMAAPLNVGMLSQTVQLLESKANYIAQNNWQAYYGQDYYRSTIPNYNGHETPNAAYAMATINLGPEVTVIGGVRFQTFQTSYTGVAGVTSPESYWAYNHYDTTITRYEGYWLPDIALRYKPLSWFDVRLSYTNTLAYPSYSAFVPKIDMSATSIGWNNYNLVPAYSKNYDLYLSFYDNSIGLFTAGAFLKKISNMIYSWSFYVSGDSALMYLPQNLATFSSNASYHISTYENNPYLNQVYGFELEWQTRFWYLPGVLSGLVFDANYTHTKSSANYPYAYSVSTGRTIQYIDTSFSDRLVDQPDNIFNLSLGFDYCGFSVRLAYVYQANIFTSASQWPQLRGYTAAYDRWDIEARQELPWFGTELYGDIYNLNSANDVSVIQGGPPNSIEDYGSSADLGLRWTF